VVSISICIVFVSILINSSYAQSVDNFKTYTNNDLNFTIQHPSAWQIAFGSEDNSGMTGMTSAGDSDSPANITANISFAYDNSSGMIISDVSAKQADIRSIGIIGMIQNKSPFTIEGVGLAIQMYDKENHLIGVESGYPQIRYFYPDDKTGFEIIDYGLDNISDLDHIDIQISATDWGNSTSANSSNISNITGD
jgi:hypothetical protein